MSSATSWISLPRPPPTKPPTPRPSTPICSGAANDVMSASMEHLHISEADAVRDLAAILKRVQAGAEAVIERDAQPLAVLRAAAPARRTISQCIALAEAHEKEAGQAPELDPDFAADVEEIVRTDSYFPTQTSA